MAKKSSPLTVADAHKQITRELRELDEPDRTALIRVHSTLNTAQALALTAFGETVTPDHTLALLGHLLAEAERAQADHAAFDEDE